MADNQRIDDLRRRVHKDPASIAFAQLAEEFRRAGQFQEAVDVCHAGLEIHPTYLSARVTLGRAFIELNKLDEAQSELEQVLKGARENLAAIRGLAEIHHRRGELGEALTQYRAALALARNDPELQFTVSELSKQVQPAKPAPPAAAVTVDGARREPPAHAPVAEPPAHTKREPPAHAPIAEPETLVVEPERLVVEPAPPVLEPETFVLEPETSLLTIAEPVPVAAPPAPAPVVSFAPAPPIAPPAAAAFFLDTMPAPFSVAARGDSIEEDSTRARAARTIVALELWLGAIHVARAHQNA